MMPRTEQPLVSWIMPTADRRRFVPLAIENLMRQDYPNKELPILDDGRDSVADLVSDDLDAHIIFLLDRHPIKPRTAGVDRSSLWIPASDAISHSILNKLEIATNETN